MDTKICLMLAKDEVQKLGTLLENVNTQNLCSCEDTFLNKFMKDLHEVLD